MPHPQGIQGTWQVYIREKRSADSKVSPRRPEGIQHANHKLMRRHGLHDEAFVLNVADVRVGSELNLLQR